jgi:two-component system phosphate regulon sensor histidine kinase PhoR
MPLQSTVFRWCVAVVAVVALIGAILWETASGPGFWRTPGAVTLSTAGLSAVILIVSSLFWRSYWLRPIRRIERAASKLSSGDWGIRVEPSGAEGVRRMANNLNLVAGQAQKQLSDLQQQRGGLQTLVDTLPDPILATDAQGRVILLNAPAARLLSITPSQALNQKLVSVVNDEPIVELFELLIAVPATAPGAKAAVPLHREIRMVRNGQRSIYQSVATRTAGGGALLVLRDVSTLAGAVQMKTDFVANASHELRTPIAAIKIAFETLRDVYREDPVQCERCISVIDGHLKRLEEMLRDLLDLSRVENAELKPHVAAVKTTEVLAFLKSTMGSLARAKNVELRLADQDANAVEEFHTDARLLNLVLKNLVENSIKFTPAGGKVTVTIRSAPPAPGSADHPSGLIVIEVSDTGIGIAPEHIDRVFERFYQVDPARSGSAGRGTGLGLAIVKHAIHALGGVVKLRSTVGQGTTVTCEFPDPDPATLVDAQASVG